MRNRVEDSSFIEPRDIDYQLGRTRRYGEWARMVTEMPDLVQINGGYNVGEGCFGSFRMVIPAVDGLSERQLLAELDLLTGNYHFDNSWSGFGGLAMVHSLSLSSAMDKFITNQFFCAGVKLATEKGMPGLADDLEAVLRTMLGMGFPRFEKKVLPGLSAEIRRGLSTQVLFDLAKDGVVGAGDDRFWGVAKYNRDRLHSISLFDQGELPVRGRAIKQNGVVLGPKAGLEVSIGVTDGGEVFRIGAKQEDHAIFFDSPQMNERFVGFTYPQVLWPKVLTYVTPGVD